MHRKVAQDVVRSGRDCRTLEIGAGNLNHLQYEAANGRYDVVESLTDIVAKSARRSRVTDAYADIWQFTVRIMTASFQSQRLSTTVICPKSFPIAPVF